MSGVHSVLPPSSAKIWGKPGGCTGWVGMSQMVPDLSDDNEDAKAGEASHEAGELLIRKATRADVGPVLNIGDTATNGVIVDREMLESAEMYAENVLTELSNRIVKGAISYAIEDRLTISRVHELCFGTPDMWLYDPNSNELFIWDYKFGHLIIEAFENWQAICYLAGLLPYLGIDGQLDQKTTVRVRIVQPRASHPEGPIREWSFPASEVRGKINVLEANAKIAMSPAATLQTGSQCRRCHARHACPEALKAGMSFYEMAGAPVPVELSPESLGLQNAIVTRAIEQLKGLKTGYDEQIKALQKSGIVVPGWGLEPAVGHETWSRPVEEVIQLGDLMGQDLRKLGAITPNQARKLGIDNAVITAYSHKPNAGFKLVQDDGTKARRIFGA